MKKYIDINCDVGEGMGNESQLFPHISSCNVACGGHAGDKITMQQVVSLAKNHQLRIGAHPSYPDRSNFGRISMSISAKELIITIEEQIHTLMLICEQEQVKLHHIKAHGALYNDIAKDVKLAEIFLEAAEKHKEVLFLYVPVNSVLEQMALERGFMIKREAFADRNYNENYSLVSRKESNAIISNPQLVCEHLARMVQNKKLITVKGVEKTMEADTYCIHGDTSNALQILVYLSKELPKQNIFIQK